VAAAVLLDNPDLRSDNPGESVLKRIKDLNQTSPAKAGNQGLTDPEKTGFLL